MNKVALITGTSKGIGQAIDRTLWQYNRIQCSPSTEFEDRYANILSVPCDVSNREQVKDMVNQGLAKFGRIDVLINNAGSYIFDDFENIKEEDFDNMYKVNTKGILICTQEILPIMRKQKTGHIINILSIRGITGCPGRGAYTATKFAAKGLTDSLRMELKDSNIKVTNICPGRVAPDKVTNEDICKTVDYVLSVSQNCNIRDIILGGQL